MAKKLNILASKALPKEFNAKQLSSQFKLVHEGHQTDFRGDDFPVKVYELDPHVRSIIVNDHYSVLKAGQKRRNMLTLAFPYTQFTFYKETLYATISKTPFVSPDYEGLCDLIFNHFLYGYVCLPYENAPQSEYYWINSFYTLSNTVGHNEFNCPTRLKKWEQESATPHKVLFSNSVLWNLNNKTKLKTFSLQEMLVVSYDKPHQIGKFYDKYYPKLRLGGVHHHQNYQRFN